MGPSVGFGRRVLVRGPAGTTETLDAFARELEARMNALIDEDRVLSEEHWAVDEARDYFATHGLTECEKLLGTWRGRSVPVMSYGGLYVLNMTPALPNTGALDGFFFLHDQDVLLLVYGSRSMRRVVKPSESMPPHALTVTGEPEPNHAPQSTRGLLLGQARANHDVEHQEQAWLSALGVTSIGAFNQACVRGSVPGLIRVAEGFQEKRLSLIADEIQRRASEIDIVCIAGPSSSGKTTFIRRLCVQLQVNGIQPVALGLDDYYVDRINTPRDTTGDYDFEALGALQLQLLHQHLAQLSAGQTVKTARYAFEEGKSHPSGGREIQLGPRDVLLLEGIHALNPALLGDVPARRVFRIFVCPLMQLAFDHLSRVHASDLRLIRRIVRDRHSRGYDAAATIERWPKVRAGERQHIYPFQLNADAVFDSSLVYELSVLRVYAERYLLEVPRTHRSYTTAFRLMHMLDSVVSIYPDHVPPTSILREFIGGSGFEY
jgi:uridine kinase